MGSRIRLRCLIFALITTIAYGEIDFIAERLPLQGTKPTAGSPWPMPQIWDRQEEVMTLNLDNLTFVFVTLEDCDVIQQGNQRFRRSLELIQEGVPREENSEAVNSTGSDPETSFADESGVSLSTVRIEVSDEKCRRYPEYSMNERYSVNVSEEIHLRGESIWGVLRGLETILQLIYTRNGKFHINQGFMEDYPRFQHRGLHLDTSRHYYPMDLIKANLDAMSMNKLNVFHWHIVDAQSFPYVSTRFPELSKKGAFSPRQVYTQHDVQDIIEYARVRGIRVLAEFDTPGHAHSWGKAMPELLTPCWAGGHPGVANYSYHAERENFDPSKNATFTFLREFFSEVKDVFPDAFLHMGMDEAHYMCWESSPDIAAFMESMGFGTDYTQLEQYYNTRLLSIVEGLGKKSIIWEDPINNGAVVPQDTIVQVWKNSDLAEHRHWSDYVKDALEKNYEVILSSCWYLNYIKYGPDWKDFYNCEPTDVNVSEALLSRIVGGETCVWSEYIDHTNALQRIWPRASAVAERLWSARNVTDTDEAQYRLDQHRCRMVRRGIPAQPILPGYCKDDYNTDNENTTALQQQQQQARAGHSSRDDDVTTEVITGSDAVSTAVETSSVEVGEAPSGSDTTTQVKRGGSTITTTNIGRNNNNNNDDGDNDNDTGLQITPTRFVLIVCCILYSTLMLTL